MYFKQSLMNQILHVRKIADSNPNFRMSLDTLKERRDIKTALVSANMVAVEIGKDSSDTKGKRTTVKATIIPLKENAYTCDGLTPEAEVFILIDKVKKTVKDFTDRFMQITIDKELLHEFKNKTFYWSNVKGSLYVKCSSTLRGKYKNVNGGKPVMTLPKDAVAYSTTVDVLTSSSIKTSTFYATKVEDTNMHSSCFGYFAEIFKETFNPVTIFKSAMEVAKIVTRPGLGFTGQRKLFEINTFAVVKDLSGYDMNRKGLAKADGIGLFNLNLWQKAFSLNTKEEAMGNHAQVRPIGRGFLGKIQGIPSISFKEVLEAQEEPYTIFSIDGKAPKSLDDLDAVLDLNGIKAMGYTLSRIKAVDNVVKIKEPVGINLMAISRLTEGAMSKQFVEKLEMAAARIGKDELNKVEEFIMFNFIRMMAEDITKLREAVPTQPGLDCNYILEAIKCTNPNSPLGFKTVQEQMVNAYVKVADKMAVAIKDKEGRNCIFNVTVCPDKALTMYRKGIIPEGYVVVGHFSKELARIENEFGRDSEEYKSYEAYCGKMIGVKYPSMYFFEYMDAKIMNMNDLIKLIRESDMSETIKRKLTYEYRYCCESAIFLPGDTDLMKKCAGLDFDWDKMSILLPSDNTFICDLLYGKSKLVNIDTTATRSKKIKVIDIEDKYNNAFSSQVGQKTSDQNVTLNSNNPSIFYDIYIYAVTHQGNIGEITFWNNTIIGICTEVLLGNSEPAIMFLKELFNKDNRKTGKIKKYTSDDTSVDVNFVDRIMETMSNCVWNNENITAFLDDCSKVYRLYQEGTIDSAKTGIYLTLILKCKTVKAKSLLPIYTTTKVIDGQRVTVIERKSWSEKEVTVIYEDGTKGKFKSYLLNDFIAKVQDKMVALIEKRLMEELNSEWEKHSWEDSDISFMGEVHDYCAENYTKIVEGLHRLNSIYIANLGTMLTARAEIYKNAKLDDKIKAGKVEQLEEIFNAQNKVLSATANRLMNKVDESYEYRGALALSVSMWNKGAINIKSSNRFGLCMFPEDVYSFIFRKPVDTITCEGRILEWGTAKLKKGDVVEVTRGVSDNGLVLSHKFTGSVTIGVHNKVTAEKSLKDLGVKGGYDNSLYSLTVRCSDVDRNVDNFKEIAIKDSQIVKQGNDVLFSADENSDFVDLTNRKKSIAVTDIVDDENYSINAVYEAEIALGDKNSNGEFELTPCYVIELKEVI